jgi:hypothetical protein
VNISVPGKHHTDMADVTFGAASVEGPKPPDTISDGHVGYMLQKHLAGEPLAKAFER